jgi:hypothetical protein
MALGQIDALAHIVQRSLATLVVRGLVGVAQHQVAVTADGIFGGRIGQRFLMQALFFGSTLFGIHARRHGLLLRAILVEHALFAVQALGDRAIRRVLLARAVHAGVDACSGRPGQVRRQTQRHQSYR